MTNHLRLRRAALSSALLSGFICLINSSVQAGSATWKLDPTNGTWNDAAKWTPNSIPNGATDVATFGLSNTTSISLSAVTQVGAVVFNSGASAFSIIAKGAVSLSFAGAGVTNNSGATQSFIAQPNDSGTDAGAFIFSGSASGGRGSNFTCSGGLIYFRDSSSAGSGTYVSTSATLSFAGVSSAGHGFFTTTDTNVFL